MNLTLKRTPGIFLVGFMGCGKSTIGRLLAEELGWSFVDLDDDIEAKAGVSIATIFETQGEPAFRAAESAALAARLLDVRHSRPLVVALGGGAFAQPANRAALAGHGVSIWLDCPLDRIESRVSGQEHRPLARDRDQFRELFAARREAYAEADYSIVIGSDDPAQAVRRILQIPGLF